MSKDVTITLTPAEARIMVTACQERLRLAIEEIGPSFLNGAPSRRLLEACHKAREQYKNQTGEEIES